MHKKQRYRTSKNEMGFGDSTVNFPFRKKMKLISILTFDSRRKITTSKITKQVMTITKVQSFSYSLGPMNC